MPPPGSEATARDKADDARAEPAPPLDAEPGARIGFWQEPWVQNALPLATSLALHVGILVIGIATIGAYQQIKRVVQEQTIIPDATMADEGPVGGIPHPGLGADPTRDMAQDASLTAQSDGIAEKATDNLTVAVSGGGAGESADEVTLAVGAGSAGKGKGAGTGTGDAAGAGDGTGGKLAKFGVPGGGGGIGPKAPFMGVSSNARKIVYVCDATGTMLGLKFDLLKLQLTKAVDGLKPVQSFNILFFFGERDFLEFNKGGLVAANSENKQKAFEFIAGAGCRANTNPIPALEEAFRNRPQLVYFLSDGKFDDLVSYDEVKGAIKRLNTGGAVKVNTINFITDNEAAKACLQQIANDNGGTFKFVQEKDLSGG